MSEILITRQHDLTLDQARLAAEALARDLDQEFRLTWSWSGDVLHFHTTGIKGSLAVATKEIVVRARLGFLYIPFKVALEEEIHKYFDHRFA